MEYLKLYEWFSRKPKIELVQSEKIDDDIQYNIDLFLF